MNYTKKKILFFDSTEIVVNGIIWGLLELNIDVTRSKTKVFLAKKNDEQITGISQELTQYDIAFTQNFSVNVAEACHNLGIPYISWIYDSPQISLYSDSALYDENYVFVFDKIQLNRLREFGLPHVFYQPLAANIAYTSSINITDADIKKYECDISFIGQLYLVDYFSGILNKLSDTTFNKYMAICDRTVCQWSDSISIFNTFDKEMMVEFEPFINKEDFQDFQMDPGFVSECLFLGPILAQIERKRLLNLASEHFNSSFYTNDCDLEIARKNIKGNVLPSVHEDELYKAYYSSKLNLNITLRRIETGAPQRIFDIMAVGGPVFSNYQKELPELFIPDKEIILFSSEEEFLDKAKYYLKNDSIRQRIGINGYLRVKNEYTYPLSLKKMFAQI